jgi:hypothetical protein
MEINELTCSHIFFLWEGRGLTFMRGSFFVVAVEVVNVEHVKIIVDYQHP